MKISVKKFNIFICLLIALFSLNSNANCKDFYDKNIKSSDVFNDPVIQFLLKDKAPLREMGLNPDQKFYADLIPKETFERRIKTYLKQNFYTPENELIKVKLSQPKINYPKLKADLINNDVSEENAKRYVKNVKYINNNWENLYRRTPEKTESSLIPLPNPFIVPGGRFREVYYWDSYFTILGLERSGLSDVSDNMVENFLYLVNKYGFIPNSNRIYYLSRSQPPFFALMIEKTRKNKNKEWLGRFYEGVVKEYWFWMKPGEHYINEIGLNRYYDSKDVKRIEAFGDDNKNLVEIPDKFYQNERSICESGLDFSKKYSAGALNIIPVELNSLLYRYETLLSNWALKLGKQIESKEWAKRARVRKQNMFKYLYDKESGIFQDYNFNKKIFTNYQNLTSIYPLWVRLLDKNNPEENKIAATTREFVLKNLEKPYGVILLESKKTITQNAFIKKDENEYQWDSPNGWAPLQLITIEGLKNYGFYTDSERITRKWIDLNTDVFEQEGKFFEKYNVISGNQNIKTCYPGQDGFGWTNGVYLELIYELLNK